MSGWRQIDEAPEGIEVETCISDIGGERNRQTLKRQATFWLDSWVNPKTNANETARSNARAIGLHIAALQAEAARLTAEIDTVKRSRAQERDCANICDENARLREAIDSIRKTVDEQAEDESLWTLPLAGTQPIMEAYLQQELRRLHAVIERNIPNSVADGAVQS